MSDSKDKTKKPVIGISVGDINGIGPEVIMKSLEDARIMNQFTPVIYGSGKLFAFYRKHLKINSFNYQQIDSLSNINEKKVNLLNIWDEAVDITPGQKNAIGGEYAVRSLKAAVKDLKEEKIDALTTAPINKENVQSENFQFPGHTEYLASEADSKNQLMFLVHDSLRIGVATGHIPLSEVSQKLTKELILNKTKAMIKSLQFDFGIKKPKIAILGLNPHAGENGLLGTEEERIIDPVISELKSAHQIVSGPYPADGFFGMKLHTKFDGILGMYHDQGLIPFKTMAFDEGVNFTANLPFIRTSPDHGTAYEIAGKNLADETSFRNALYLAADISKKRNEKV